MDDTCVEYLWFEAEVEVALIVEEQRVRLAQIQNVFARRTPVRLDPAEQRLERTKHFGIGEFAVPVGVDIVLLKAAQIMSVLSGLAIGVLIFDDYQAIPNRVQCHNRHTKSSVGIISAREKCVSVTIGARAKDATIQRVVIDGPFVFSAEICDWTQTMRAHQREFLQTECGEAHVRQQEAFRRLGGVQNIREVAGLLRRAQGGWMQDSRAFIDARGELVGSESVVRCKAKIVWVLTLARTRQVAAIILIDNAQVETAVPILAPAGKRPAERQGPVIIEIAVFVAAKKLGDSRSDETSFGGADDECSVRPAKKFNESPTQIVGVFGAVLYGPSA